MSAADPLYKDRAERFKPRTPEGIAQAARELLASGFSDHTVAHILKLDVNAIRQMIGESAP